MDRRTETIACVAGLALLGWLAAAGAAAPAQADDGQPAGRLSSARAVHCMQGYNGWCLDAATTPTEPPVKRVPGGRIYRASSRYPVSVGHVGCPGCGRHAYRPALRRGHQHGATLYLPGPLPESRLGIPLDD